MPRVSSATLEKVTSGVFRAVGAPEEDARITAHIIVESNLTGHESHGVVALPRYLDFIQKGYIVPGAATETVAEGPSYALIDGHKNFGHIVAYRATQMAIEKARKHTIACVGMKNVQHIGRVGAYSEMIAAAGMGGIVSANSGGPSHAAAPYGGTKGRMGTNPISIAFPSDLGPPAMLDMSTTAHAYGKITAYERQGTPFPDDWLLDSEGNPTTDPAVFRQGGGMRTFGGHVGYKGYGLSFFVDVMAGMLSRNGYSRDMQVSDQQKHVSNGTFIIAINCASFLPLETLKQEVGDLAGWVKSSPPAEGFDEVSYPGEPEARTREERLANGVPLDGATWEEIRGLAEEFGVEMPEALQS